jgi:hypothetical protein
MNNKVFENYDEAKIHSLTVPWKLETCNVGEDCWCRIIVPKEKFSYNDKERIVEFQVEILGLSRVQDGSIDKKTAEYMVGIHNQLIKTYKSQKERLAALQKLSELDQELGLC